MRNFNQSGGNRGKFKSDGRGSSRNSSGYKGRGDRDQVTMHQAVCDKCGQDCEVPFRPSGDKPVYCKSCFDSMRPDDDRAPRRDSNRNQGSFARKPERARDNRNTERQFETMIAKIDQLVVSINRLADSMAGDKTYKKVEDKLELAVKKPVAKKPKVKKTVVKKARKAKKAK